MSLGIGFIESFFVDTIVAITEGVLDTIADMLSKGVCIYVYITRKLKPTFV